MIEDLLAHIDWVCLSNNLLSISTTFLGFSLTMFTFSYSVYTTLAERTGEKIDVLKFNLRILIKSTEMATYVYTISTIMLFLNLILVNIYLTCFIFIVMIYGLFLLLRTVWRITRMFGE